MSSPVTAAATPSRESERLATLRRLEVLDSAEETVFDNLTRLAATICEVPISLVSLVDADRQWFKSHFGLAERQTPRETAFCAHTICQQETLIVNDATQDARFRNNPLVTGHPDIRFYAGAPLLMENGVAIGSLCVIDRQPRALTPTQLDALEILRDTVVAQLELRQARKEVDVLQRIVPMCAWCRKIRVDDAQCDHWIAPDRFVMRHSETSHGMCPDCAEQFDSD